MCGTARMPRARLHREFSEGSETSIEAGLIQARIKCESKDYRALLEWRQKNRDSPRPEKTDYVQSNWNAGLNVIAEIKDINRAMSHG